MRRSRKRSSSCVYVTVIISMSITGSEKPAPTRASPRSCMSMKRCRCSASDGGSAARSSLSVSGPRGGEHQHAADLQGPVDLLQGRQGVVEPLQHQVGPSQRDAAACQGQGGGVGANEIRCGRLAKTHQALEQTFFAARLGEHGWGTVDRDARNAGVALRESRQVGTGAAAQVEDALRLDADVVEAFAHAPGDFPGQGVDAGVTGRGLLGPAPYEAWVELEIRHAHRIAAGL